MEQFFKILIYIVAANIAFLIFSLIKQGFKHYSNYIAELAFLLIGIFWLSHKEIASGWVFLIFVIGVFILVILPVIIQGKIDSLMADDCYDEIEFYAKIKAAIAWSYPNSHLQDLAEIASKYYESPMKMVEELKKLLNRGEPYDGMTRMFLGTIHFNRRNYNDLINDLRDPKKPLSEHRFEELLYLVRAYLESTRYDEAIDAQIELEKKMYETSDNPQEQKSNAIINRFVFYAFMGWKEEYDACINSGASELNVLPPELREFWRGVCYFYSGDYEDGEKKMQAVISKLPEEAFEIKEFMQKRIYGMLEHKVFFDKHILPKLQQLHKQYNKQIADLIEAKQKDNIEIKPTNKVSKIISFIIMTISLILIIAFNVEDRIELINMGAASSFLVKNGEYFRLITYMFIHIGYIHLFMNLIALKYFAPPIETLGGWQSLLIIFFGSGIAGGLASSYFGNNLTVGASGGVLGLLSAAIVFELFKLKGDKKLSNQSSFSTLIFILVINILFGFYEKGIDNYAHFGGLLAGAILSLLFVIPQRFKKLKIFINFASVVLTLTVIISAFYQYSILFNSNSFYPNNIKDYKKCEVASTTFTLEIPTSWNPDKDSATLQELNIDGPVGEKLNIVFGLNTDSHEKFLNEFIEQRRKSLEWEENINIESIKGPTKLSSNRENTYVVDYNLKVNNINVELEDYIIFDNQFVYILRLTFATNKIYYYYDIMRKIVTSLKLK